MAAVPPSSESATSLDGSRPRSLQPTVHSNGCKRTTARRADGQQTLGQIRVEPGSDEPVACITSHRLVDDAHTDAPANTHAAFHPAERDADTNLEALIDDLVLIVEARGVGLMLTVDEVHEARSGRHTGAVTSAGGAGSLRAHPHP